MLLLIDNRQPWEPPAPPAPQRRRLHLPRPRTSVLKLLLAAALIVIGAIAPGLAGVALLVSALLVIGSAASTALPYRLGLKEHRQ